MKRPALLTSGWSDFHRAARHPSRDNQSFATVDADGVALATIQGLNEKVESGKQKAETRLQKLEGENAELRKEGAELKQELKQLKQLVEKFVRQEETKP